MECGFIIFILIVIIIALLAYILLGGKNLFTKGDNVGNQTVEVLDDVTYQEYEDEETVVLKVKNTSSEVFNNVSPVLIYFDANGMPIHEGWGSRVSYFAPGDIRCIRFYDTIKDYDTVKLGFFDREEDITFTDLRDKISYEVEKADEPDEDGDIRLTIKGENKSDKDIVASFEIAYYSEGKLIYLDEFLEVVKANSSLNTYEYYETEFYDGKKFPEGFTYEVKLVEAVDYLDDTDDIDLSKDVINEDTDFNVDELSDEEKIEHALYKVFKDNYGEKLDSAKIYVDKIYTEEEIEEDEALKSLDIKEDELAFEATIYLLPAEGVDPNELMTADGEFDEDSGWIQDISRLGILTPDGEGKYKIRNLGTGW